jgi:hypothetical protein
VSFDRTLLDMMPATVTYQRYTGISTDGYATQTWSTGSGLKSVRARIQAVRANERTVPGREVKPEGFKVLMAPYSTAGTSDTVTVTALDKITLPAGFLVAGSCSPPIVRAYPCQDEDGLHHNEVWL